MRALVLFAVSSLLLVACGESADPSAARAAPRTPAIEAAADSNPVGVTPLASDFMRGVCLAHSYQHGGSAGYGSETSAHTLDELAQLGATWVSLTPFGFMESLRAQAVRPIFDHAAGETDARLRAEIQAAHARGLAVQLKPHIWIHGGAWRAQIDPGDDAAWARWFGTYRAWMLHYAHLASGEHVEALVVGVELGSAVRHVPELFRTLIRDIRAFYSGQLLYAANWDAVDEVPFWGDLDAIGVQFYAPLADRAHDTSAALVAHAGRALDAFEAVSRRVHRPVVLTEVGYRCASDAALRPHEWPERSTTQPDPEAQAAAYEALLGTVARRPFIRGLFVWKWFTDPATDEEGPAGFSPRGKPAAELLRRYYAAPRARRSSEGTTRLEAPSSSANVTSARPSRGASVER